MLKPRRPANISYGTREVTIEAKRASFRLDYEDIPELAEALNRVKASKPYTTYLKKAGLA